ncbi:MAG: SagB/ThcOx family dehydrogenase [Sedimentisphaerales bacterium]|nr:SagB/ThcOx family dehydrogenase [Sedimentisphaerales bacterium]
MKTKSFPVLCLVLTVLLIWPAQILAVDANSTAAKDVNSAGAAELKPIQPLDVARGGELVEPLPKPQTDGGKPLMQALKDRKSSREFSAEKLPPQVLSNMLWAACGINRPDGKRTAPTARNWQEIDVYVATAEGLYLYDANSHSLKPILKEDIRAATSRQPFVKDAPVNLIFVADFSKMGNAPADQKDFYAATDTGFISQNVYLYCASEGLATVVRGAIDKPAMAQVMKLRPDQKVILAQTVGYPKK